MWTMFLKHHLINNPGEYDVIYVEANQACSKMFLDAIYDKTINDKYYISYSDSKPMILNVEEYSMFDRNTEIKVRVICEDELIDRCLVSNCIHRNNLLTNPNHSCIEYNSIPF